MDVVGFIKGRYYISGFIRKDGKYAYFSYSVPRYGYPIDFNKTDACEGFLLRTAENEHDFRGGHNNFTNLSCFMDMLERLLK